MLNTVLAFYHPQLGLIRGAVHSGRPFIVASDVAHLLNLESLEELKRTLGEHFHDELAAIPAVSDRRSSSAVERVELLDEDMVWLCVTNTSSDLYRRCEPWLRTFVFPVLRRMGWYRDYGASGAERFWESSAPDSLNEKRWE